MDQERSASDIQFVAIMTNHGYAPIADSSLSDLKNGPSEVSPLSDYHLASDEDLLTAARSSDELAFAELCGRYRKSLYKVASRIVRHREDAEDVVQDTFFRAYLHLGYFRGTCRFSSWLTRIAINTALMLLRRRRSRPEVPCDQRGNEERKWEIREFPDPSPNPEQAYEERQTHDKLSRAVTRLPPAHRSVMIQHLAHEKSMQEIADTIGISVAATKSRLLRARLRIRSAMEEVNSGKSKALKSQFAKPASGG
ncbi:RNA polymerase sigma factor [Occallatibacter riparius]|uniref:Sigma-70 family RNA polymerase sigma factor n=1 Tax=Occallatibacter riparius TaxID=1002689 RepID=A0A9J7BRK6_9BACT|nr:sigma-70 family RNA polymerase sigma factor [Occallatibacter riparius]UWZ85207.1 sigma-70 family RNA polymerase sigma factor [Occallatibacter riparius]